MGGLGPYLEYDGEDYICSICDRYFRTDGALFAHCRATTRHEWSTDFESNQDLRDHLVGYHHACLECNIFLESAEGLRSHDISDHCLCDVCDKYFSNENNLRMKHQAKTLECYGCYHNFKSFSGMLIHLESGACSSGVTEDTVDDLAKECYQSRRYTVETDGGWRYECPECEKEFTKLSALYQHVEDVPSCSHLANGDGCLAKLERFMASRSHKGPVLTTVPPGARITGVNNQGIPKNYKRHLLTPCIPNLGSKSNPKMIQAYKLHFALVAILLAQCMADTTSDSSGTSSPTGPTIPPRRRLPRPPDSPKGPSHRKHTEDTSSTSTPQLTKLPPSSTAKAANSAIVASQSHWEWVELLAFCDNEISELPSPWNVAELSGVSSKMACGFCSHEMCGHGGQV
ncbi:hypothetical protein BDQ94DRAFT_159994 [Aspergillus welwitschiae]|uniref:C2H2-type domain-containing protein n=1 Tax=Aspergillus welwitschiae TaxID=1341132 RepID=A0A3F3PZR0_9EURO|nr:hypothetical protein BDQ94DRAFT_159994 [Aspergillus welwitschiae]RDH32361.1 hypothetical protein BDQ94DRAFT_159994 [Aspergillus welwitschiae]